MRVTVCELVNRDREAFEAAWSALAAHVVESDSELLLLPEMPFSRWLAAQPTVDAPRWAASVRAHEQRLTELPPLGAATLCSTRPVGTAAGQRFQQSVVRTPGGAFLQPTHRKCLLPEEPGWHESRWYQPWRHGQVETFEAPDGRRLPLGTLLFEADGIGRFAVEICEDGWRGIRPASVYALAGAEIVGNPSASWFMVGKHGMRRRLVEQVSREDHVVYAYTSLSGCDATRLVFDGSTFIAADGRREVAEMEKFNEAVAAVGISSEIVHRAFDRYFSETMPGSG